MGIAGEGFPKPRLRRSSPISLVGPCLSYVVANTTGQREIGSQVLQDAYMRVQKRLL